MVRMTIKEFSKRNLKHKMVVCVMYLCIILKVAAQCNMLIAVGLNDAL